MPQRWICCRCDNGWTYQPTGDNICGNSNCGHSKCGGCELRSYSSGILEPAQDDLDFSDVETLLCGQSTCPVDLNVLSNAHERIEFDDDSVTSQ
ncbi:hypothetical protein BDZ91DRAFT_714487 [Kalaharituber pfeilii]|nr:hypothetical protein BDZ91DRAFT_714487 [Kalaharituber pfeilii]